MQVHSNASLKNLNTFGIDAKAKKLVVFSDASDLDRVFEDKELSSMPRMILGGGSNILFTRDFDGLVLKNDIRGIEVADQDDDSVIVEAGSGENWHQFVMTCIENNWAGLENLSLIPGNVGASPMQNIGAYGVEVKDRFKSLKAYNIQSGKVETFTSEECEFGYRESVFKRRFKDKYIILSVSFRLLKVPEFNISYGAIEGELNSMGIKELSLRAVSDAVINIRNSKLPNPAVLGNAGSFFKNPVVSEEKYRELVEKHPAMPFYPAPVGQFKVAAGWLIEQCGWKGFRRGNCGVHSRQALVLVNYGGATGKEIYDLSEDILQDVKSKFDVELEREVNIV